MSGPHYRSRGYLPHLEIHGSTYFITLRLADTLPRTVLDEMRMELRQSQKAQSNEKLLNTLQQRLKYLQTRKVQDYLDNGSGACRLKEPAIAALIHEAILHHEGDRYITHVCCIMPNHLHWILTPLKKRGMGRLDSRVIPIVQRFKSYTAHCANKVLQRSGPFWAREYYDHRIRDSEQFDRLVRYTLENPVKAKLCRNWQEWRWTICSESLRNAISG